MIGSCTPCWPPPLAPWPPLCDPELNRLRRLEQHALREQEKARIRERLRQMGVDPDAAMMGRRPLCPTPHVPRAASIDDLIEIARRSRRGRK